MMTETTVKAGPMKVGDYQISIAFRREIQGKRHKFISLAAIAEFMGDGWSTDRLETGLVHEPWLIEDFGSHDADGTLGLMPLGIALLVMADGSATSAEKALASDLALTYLGLREKAIRDFNRLGNPDLR